MQLSDTTRGVILMNVAMASFTLNDVAMKVAMKTVPLFQAISMRGIVTTAVLVAIALRLGAFRQVPSGSDRRMIGLRVVFELASTLFFLAALVHMELANLSAIMQALPLAVTLAAAVFLGEPLGWRRTVAILAGFAGVMMILKPGAEGFDRWSVLGVLSMLAVVVRDLSTRRISRAVPSALVAVTASGSVLAMGLCGVLAEGWQPVTLREAGLIGLAALFLVSGYLSVVGAMRVGDLAAVAPFRYTALLWAILSGWVVFGDLPDGWTVAGAGVVVASGIYAMMREARRKAEAARKDGLQRGAGV